MEDKEEGRNNSGRTEKKFDLNGVGDIIAAMGRAGNIINSIINSEQIKNTINIMSSFGKWVSDIVSSDYMKSVSTSFAKFGKIILDAYDNPNSIVNYYEYQKELEKFHWAWPFEISADELKMLIEQANNEKEFDRIILSFFSKDRVQKMLSYIYDNLPRKHKVIFKQIEEAYGNKHYAIVNNAVFSIIDNILSTVLKDKGCTSRKGLLLPIIDYYSDNFDIKDVCFLIQFQMLSNNIDLVFEDYDFNNVAINTNKKVYRHLSIHGYMYSNNKVDTIMLLNTLAAVLVNRPYIIPFKNTLVRRNKGKNRKFIINTKLYVVRNRIFKGLNILSSKEKIII